VPGRSVVVVEVVVVVDVRTVVVARTVVGVVGSSVVVVSGGASFSAPGVPPCVGLSNQFSGLKEFSSGSILSKELPSEQGVIRYNSPGLLDSPSHPSMLLSPLNYSGRSQFWRLQYRDGLNSQQSGHSFYCL